MQNFSQLIDITRAINGGANLDNENTVFITAENAQRTLYLADLPKNITYIELSEFFEQNIGPCNITIKRPLFKDFYYAFVQFQKLDHARKALSEFRFPTLGGGRCRIAIFNKANVGVMSTGDKKSVKVSHQLFVKSLPKHWTHEELFNQFTKFGNVVSCKVSVDGSYVSRGYGFVEMDSEANAQKAITELNDRHIQVKEEPSEKDFKLTVCEYVPRQDRPGLGKPRCSTNLYVKNFPTEEGCDFTDDQLRDCFTPFGELVSCVIMRDENGKSKQFGFVCFKQNEDAQKALNHFSAAKENAPDPANTHPSMYVCEAKTKEQRRLELTKSAYQFKRSMQLMNLIVRNVDPECTKEEFEGFFKNFGEVRSTKLVPEASVGFVCFVDRESARNAKESNNLVLRDRKLSVSFCEPKESRQKYLEETWDRRFYDRQKQQVYKSNNQDVLSLITSLSLLMSQLSNNKGGRQQAPYQMNMNPSGFQNQNGMARMANRQNYPQQQNGYPAQNQSQYFHQNEAPPQAMVRMGMGSAVPQQQQMPQPIQYNGYKRPGAPQPIPPVMQQMQAANQGYTNEVMKLFGEEKFMKATETQKKYFVGSFIFPHVSQMVGDEISPKVTGMIIDLPLADLNYSVSSFDTLQAKVRSAVQLLVDTKFLDSEVLSRVPIAKTLMKSQPNAQQAKAF